MLPFLMPSTLSSLPHFLGFKHFLHSSASQRVTVHPSSFPSRGFMFLDLFSVLFLVYVYTSASSHLLLLPWSLLLSSPPFF